MAIQLIYRDRMIMSLPDEHSGDTNMEDLKMIQRIVVGEFLVCMLKVIYRQIAYSLPINIICFSKRPDKCFMRYACL